jgi:segregation and condensation protein A
LPQAERDFMLVRVWVDHATVERLPEVSAEDLRNAWLRLVARSQINRSHRVTREELSVRAHMSAILIRLGGRKFVEFSELFDPGGGIAELIVAFLALLELIRDHQVEVTQHRIFGIIYVSPIDAIESA